MCHRGFKVWQVHGDACDGSSLAANHDEKVDGIPGLKAANGVVCNKPGCVRCDVEKDPNAGPVQIIVHRHGMPWRADELQGVRCGVRKWVGRHRQGWNVQLSPVKLHIPRTYHRNLTTGMQPAKTTSERRSELPVSLHAAN